jgi:hypothetical protein
MRYRVLSVLAVAAGLALWTPGAQAGAVRYAGKQITKGTAAVASAAASGGSAVAGGVVSAGQSTKGAVATAADAVGDGAVAVAKGATATPGLVAHGTSKAARAVWHKVW